MANATYEVLELRVLVKKDWTELYVLCGPTSDGTLGVQGWHHRVISRDTAALTALEEALRTGEYLTSLEWSQKAPPYFG